MSGSDGAGPAAFWPSWFGPAGVPGGAGVEAPSLPFSAAAWTEHLSELTRIAAGASSLEPGAGDDRFEDEAWRSNPMFRRLMQCYLSYCRFVRRCAAEAGLSGADRVRADYQLESWLSAIAPTNNPFTNPVVLRRTLDTGGANLVDGYRNFLDDQVAHKGVPAHVDRERFEPGRDLATTRGSVVHRDGLCEAIQYAPATAEVHERPVVYCSSMLNRYYISDLTPPRSLFKALVDEGFTVFAVVWRNPGPEHADCGLARYVEALFDAVEVACRITGQASVNLVGFCAGGTVTLAASAIDPARPTPRIHSHSLGMNAVHVEPEESLSTALSTPEEIERMRVGVTERGLVPAEDLHLTYTLLQPDRLVWPYVVSNYLLGERPEGNEVMYWMNDQVNLTARLFCDFLDITHEQAFLTGALEIDGEVVELGCVRADTFILAAERDHVMPWKCVFRTRAHLECDQTFLLSNGGHVTPLITPEGSKRERYYTNGSGTRDAQAWRDTASETAGSWRRHWFGWLADRSGPRIEAPTQAGCDAHPVLGEAPGLYVTGDAGDVRG